MSNRPPTLREALLSRLASYGAERGLPPLDLPGWPPLAGGDQQPHHGDERRGEPS